MKMNKQLYETPHLEDFIIEPYNKEFILGRYSGIVIDTFFSINSLMRYLKYIENELPVWFSNQDGSYTKANGDK